MKRFLFVLLLLALLVLSACRPLNYVDSSHKQMGVGCGTISVDYNQNFPENVENAARFQVEDNGAKFYIIKAGTYTNADALDSNYVKAFDAASSAKVAALGNDRYRMTVSYSGLADGEYELHWKYTGDGNKLTVTARDKNGAKLGSYDGSDYIDEMRPLDVKNNNEYIRFRVTSNAGAPATGDGAQPLFWAIAALIGLAGIIVLSRRRVRG